MGRYIKSFENDAAIQAAVSNSELLKPYVAYDESAQTIDWNTKEKPHDYSKEYFTIEALESGNLYIYTNFDYYEYQINQSDSWVKFGNNSTYNPIQVTSGDTVKFRIFNTNNRKGFRIIYLDGYQSVRHSVYGNFNTLVDKNSFSTSATSINNSCFSGDTVLVSAEHLVLPIDSVGMNNLFIGCTSLTTAPELPSTVLTNQHYQQMFYNCTSLTQAPVLPATTLTEYCYAYMFEGCTSLTQAPELPATTLTNSCYYYMFNRCTSLNYIKCLATDISASDCTFNWVYGVAASGTFVKKAGVNWPTGTNGIPNGWTVVEE